MPLFLCRWRNGDCSVVWAPHKEDAIVELDQVANVGGQSGVETAGTRSHGLLR